MAHQVKTPSTLIAFLVAQLPQLNRNSIKDRLRDGAVRVNNVVTTRATHMLAAGDVVALGNKTTVTQAAKDGVEILHVDQHLVVVGKPAGLLTVRGGAGGEPTLLNIVGKRLVGEARLFPCHRLDRGTSGVLVLPRTLAIQEFFFAHWSEVEKIYVAVVCGRLRDDAGTIDAPLYEHAGSLDVTVSDREGARSAVTHYRVLKRSAQHTLVELRLETGRKHQIRVHMQHLGHPVAGDERYATGKQPPRLCLHARELHFAHPTTQQPMRFSIDVPPEFALLF